MESKNANTTAKTNKFEFRNYISFNTASGMAKMLLSAIEKPKLDTGYCPFVIEIFDQYGLLAGKINKFGCYECTRNVEEKVILLLGCLMEN